MNTPVLEDPIQYNIKTEPEEVAIELLIPEVVQDEPHEHNEFQLAVGSETTGASSSKRKYGCEICSKSFFTKDRLLTHKMKNHGSSEEIRKYLHPTFTEAAELYPDQVWTYKCDKCCLFFRYKPQFITHNRKHSGDIDVKSNEDNPNEDSSKEKWSASENSFVCVQCKKTFTSKDRLLIHKMRNHENNEEVRRYLQPAFAEADCTFAWPYKCVECQIYFRYKTLFITHNRIHSGKMIAYDMNNLNLPEGATKIDPKTIDVAQTKLNLICDVCKKTFTSKDRLLIHKMKNHGESEEFRKYLQPTFSEAAELYPDMDWSYKCDACGIFFRYKTLLDSHDRTHKKKRTYVEQQHAYNQVPAAKSYKKTVYTCDLCQKTFNAKCILLMHKNKVHNIQIDFQNQDGKETFLPYRCETCNLNFKYKNFFEEHNRSLHAIIPDRRNFKSELEGHVAISDKSEEQINPLCFEQIMVKDEPRE
ncbi:zinc finger protein 182-like [Uranotaenia lowii]|uniref:zinc finger protein 182-like n=1 Tax=Uranotaenia lowii TaxID=190385 RepID=UPI00247A01D3|nr:zinc finger protein 182-like [Uranotaenia lowii]